MIGSFGANSVTAGTLKGEFKFTKKPPRGAILYFSEDSSLSEEPVMDQKKLQVYEINYSRKKRGTGKIYEF